MKETCEARRLRRQAGASTRAVPAAAWAGMITLTGALSILACPSTVVAQPRPGAQQAAAMADTAALDTVPAADTAAVTPDTTTTLGLAIPPADIPRRAEETTLELRAMMSRLQPEQALAARVREIQDIIFSLGRQRAEVELLDMEELSVRAVEDMRQSWLAHATLLAGWQARLGDQAGAIVAERDRLREIDEIWSETLRSATAKSPEEVPASLIARTESVLAIEESVVERVRFQRDIILTLQDQVSQEVLSVSEVLAAIDAAQRLRLRGLLALDGPPLWVAIATERDPVPPALQLRRSVTDNFSQVRAYVSTGRPALWVHLGLFVGLALILAWLGYLSRRWPEDDPNLAASARILGRPVSGALLIALLLTREFHPTAPLALFDLSRLILLVPVLRLLPETAFRKLRAPVLVTAGLFVLDSLRQLAFPDSLFQRVTLFGWSVIALLAVVWLSTPNGPLARLGRGAWARAALILGRVGAAALLAAVLANLFGYLDLAAYLATATLAAGYAGIVLYAAYLVLGGAWRAILRSKLSTSLKALRVHTETAERRGLLLLRATGAVVWIIFIASVLGAGDQLIDAVSSAMTAGFEVGSVTVSIGSILAFAITVWLAVILSGIIRALLTEDIFPKTRHARAADTISTVVYWLLLFVGFLFAAAAAGFEIGRLTLLAGAFGVGIGFGLQDVVNNFVSGLILAFERPIQVGDIVALGGTDGGAVDGTVSRIGMRSSVIRTFAGAEVIVPNSSLISNQMINWTRSDRLRRVEIPVGVAYGTDQQKVFEVLMDVAKKHSDVLDHPEPNVLLGGFGESSLNFLLRFWTYRFDGFRRVQSEVTQAVLDGLKEAGITIPFPQRDLHLKTVAPGAREPVPELEIPTFSDSGDV